VNTTFSAARPRHREQKLRCAQSSESHYPRVLRLSVAEIAVPCGELPMAASHARTLPGRPASCCLADDQQWARGGSSHVLSRCARSLCAVTGGVVIRRFSCGVKMDQAYGMEDGRRETVRAATYMIPSAAGDPTSAECVVYFFGAGKGGSVEANLDRWKGQILAPGGKPSDAKIAKRTIHGLPVTTIDASGDYTGMGRPMAPSKSVQKNYRLLGAIVEGPGGNVLIKSTGPAKTIAASQAEFEQLLNSFEIENSYRDSNRIAASALQKENTNQKYK